MQCNWPSNSGPPDRGAAPCRADPGPGGPEAPAGDRDPGPGLPLQGPPAGAPDVAQGPQDGPWTAARRGRKVIGEQLKLFDPGNPEECREEKRAPKPEDKRTWPRKYLAPPGLTEAQKKEKGLKQTRQSKKKNKEFLRRVIKARKLGHDWTAGTRRYGVPGLVTSDMVNEALEIPKKDSFSVDAKANNMNGGIFKHKEKGKQNWKYVGMIFSTREGSHSRQICAWALEDRHALAREHFNKKYDDRGRPIK